MRSSSYLFASAAPIAVGLIGSFFAVTLAGSAGATEPCGDFGECQVLVEINSSDGDIGFHWLVDGDEQRSTSMRDPSGRLIWRDQTKGALSEQRKTENFGESSEPPCWFEEGNEDVDWDEDEVVTLEDFVERWETGIYQMSGKGEGGEKLEGETELSFHLPAAPTELEFDGTKISWEPGDDLGRCADTFELAALVAEGILPAHPMDVAVRAWEVVLEPDLDDGDPLGTFKFIVRVPPSSREVEVPAAYLEAMPEDTPVKFEVGAIGGDFTLNGAVEGDDDNATFSEEDGFCLSDDGTCDD